jgi:diacylglycerol O-acyltransferase
MDPMSPLDASFLHLENDCNHMHIAVVAIFEGPPPGGDQVEEMISSKLHLVPRYRQKVRFVPFDLGQPVWSDDHHFDLRYHVRHTALPSPGSDEQLCTLVGRVMSQKLDRAKPLWEAWIVEGLMGGRWAILSKTHHCLVDGVAGSDLLSVVLDSEPEAEHPPSVPWEPERRPTGFSLAMESLADGFRKPREGFRAARRATISPLRALRDLADFTEGLSTFHAFSQSALETSLNGPIGPHRRWCFTSTTLAENKKIRNARGGTVNDVVLSVVAQGFRSLLLSRGESVDGLCTRSLVPVSLRTEAERGTFNNRIAAVFVDLPMGISDPDECLAAVRADMDDLKEHHQASAAEALSALTGYTPPALLALGARIFAGLEQHAVQTVTTNVPGPRQPLYAAHRRMLAAYPYVPLVGSVRIGIAIFSYAGSLGFGITGDYESASDIGVLAAGIEAGIADLMRIS